MNSARNARSSLFMVVVCLFVVAAAVPVRAQTAGEWKVFQEFNFLTGSWSGPAESAGRVGGRVVSFGLEVDGATLGYRATTYYPAKDSLPESRTEEVAKIVYDGARGKYVALVVFSTKAWGIFDAEVRPDGSIRFSSREAANLEAGVRLRWTLSRRADGTVLEEIEVALPGREFAPFLSSPLARK